MFRNCALTILSLIVLALFEKLPAEAQLIGVNTAGTVRVNSLGCLESLINIGCIGFEVLGILIGLYFLLRNLKTAERSIKNRNYALAAFFILGPLQLPSTTIWLLESARNASLFS